MPAARHAHRLIPPRPTPHLFGDSSQPPIFLWSARRTCRLNFYAARFIPRLLRGLDSRDASQVRTLSRE
jgi:hypothetical protein